MNYVILGIGVYMIFFTYNATAKNFKSKLFLKFIPVISGLTLAIYAIKMLGWI